MVVTRTLQSRFTRAGAVDQMFNHQIGRGLSAQLWQRYHGPQQLADVGRRERRQLIHAQLFGQLRVARVFLAPLQLGLRDEPGRQADQRQFVFPSRIFLRPQLIPACFALGLADRGFDEVALALATRQDFEWRSSLRVRERVVNFAVAFAPHHQPLLDRLFALMGCPDQPRAELVLDVTTLGHSHTHAPPFGLRSLPQAPDFDRAFLTQHASSCGSTAFARLALRHSDYGLVQVDLLVARHVRHIGQLESRSLAPQPVAAPVERVEADPIEEHPFEHPPAQLDLGGESLVGWNAQAPPFFGFLTPEPMLRQEQFAIYPGPQPILGISQEGPDLRHLDFTQTPVTLARSSGGLLRSLLIRALIQNQSAPSGKGRRLADLLADLLQDLLRRPGRVAHKMLDVLRRLPGSLRYLGEVALFFHSQQPAQIIPRVVGSISRRGLEALGVAFPVLVETIPQALDGLARQSPRARIKDFAFAIVRSGSCHITGLLSTRLFFNRLASS